MSSSRSLSPLQKCRPLRSRHLFRGRAERRDCFLRCLRSSLTPALRAQTRTAESLRSLLCRAYTLQGLRCVRCGCEFYAESAESCGLVILNRSDLSASTTSPKFLPPARPSRAKIVGIVLSFEGQCQSRKDRHLSLEPLCVRLLTRLSACLLALRKTERTMLTHRPFRLPTSQAVEYAHASAVSMIPSYSPARRMYRV